MPVETSITSSSAILVLEAIVETKTENCGRRNPVTEQAEELCLDWKWKLLPSKKNSYTNSGHLWEAHNLSKEHQGCLAHKELPGPGGWGGAGRASWRHSSPTPSQPRAIWEPTSVPCCPHPLTLFVKHKTDMWPQQWGQTGFFVVEFNFHSYCPA